MRRLPSELVRRYRRPLVGCMVQAQDGTYADRSKHAKGVSMVLDSSLLTDLVRTEPLRVVVDLNEVCNLRCRHCHIDAPFRPTHGDSRELGINAFTGIVRAVDEMKVFDLTLTGGEVSTMPSFTDYLRELSLLSFTVPQVITNGTTLTERTVSCYRQVGLGRISISIDGFREHNDSMRGRRAFDWACRGLRTAVKAGLNVNVITVLTAANYQHWYALSMFLKDQGIASHDLSLLCRLGRAEKMPSWLGLSEGQVRWLVADYSERSGALNAQGYRVSLNTGALYPGTWSGMPLPVHQVQDLMPGTEAVVKVTGDVHTNRLVGKGRPLGNIHQASLREVWAKSLEVRLRTAELILANPDANADNYYHLSASAIGAGAASSDLEAPTPRRPGRIRSLPSGQQLEFNPATFAVRLLESAGLAS